MILELCKIRFWQFRDCGGHIFPRIVAKIRPELKLINADFVSSLSFIKKVDKRNHNTNKKKMKIEICKTDKNTVVKLF